jgi:hypothetical protein
MVLGFVPSTMNLEHKPLQPAWAAWRVCEQGKVMCDLVPRQCTTRLIFNHPGFEEVSFLLQIDHFAHPWEWIFLIGVQRLQANLSRPTIGNVAQVAFEHGRVHSQYTARHGVLCVAILKLHRLLEQRANFRLEFGRP